MTNSCDRTDNGKWKLPIGDFWCPDTCGRCEQPCRDFLPEYCAHWASKDYCNPTVNYAYLGNLVIDLCPKSCGLCPGVRSRPAGGRRALAARSALSARTVPPGAAGDQLPPRCPSAADAPVVGQPTQPSQSTQPPRPTRAAKGTKSPKPAPTPKDDAKPAKSSAYQASPSGSRPSSDTRVVNWEQEMLGRINRQRAALKLAPLCVNAKLEAAARAHSRDQATMDTMTHVGSNGEHSWQRAADEGYSGTTAENVAEGFTSVQDVMDAWMVDESHKNNVADGAYQHVGFARAESDSGVTYWTQMFGSSTSDGCN